MDEPTRLLDSPDIDPGLRRDLDVAVEAELPALDLDAGLTRLEGAISGGGGGAGGSGGTGAAIAGMIGALALAGLAMWWVLGENAAPGDTGKLASAHEAGTDSSEQASAVEVASESETEAEAASEAEAETEAETEAESTSETETEAASETEAETDPASETDPAAEPARTHPRHATPGSLQDEMRLTARARAALAGDPATALRLARQGNRRFPEGLFLEERRALEVFALDALGRESDARRAGRRFLGLHPRGPFTERVRGTLAGGATR